MSQPIQIPGALRSPKPKIPDHVFENMCIEIQKDEEKQVSNVKLSPLFTDLRDTRKRKTTRSIKK